MTGQYYAGSGARITAAARYTDPVMDLQNEEWRREGATLSDRTARQEFGLTQDEIYDAIDAGKLHYRQAAMRGSPWLRLLRRR